MFGLDRESTIWLGIYFPVSWLTQFGHGLVTTVVGPTQVYLARNTNVAIDTVNLVWTFGFFGFLIGSLVTGFVFKRYFTTSRAKLIFLFSTICVTGIFMIVLPLTSSFPVLVTCRLLQNCALGGFITADASLIVYLIGPEKSRPFTMAIHAVIGVGFLAATILVRPFLPSEVEVNKDELCSRIRVEDHQAVNGSSFIDPVSSVDSNEAVPTIAWPFIIAGAWCIFFSLGFLVLAHLPFKMPQFYKDGAEGDEQEESTHSVKYLPVFFSLLFLFYAVSCGIERIYQSMSSTFGLCGPLDLSPAEAVLTDSFYNGGFMCGRLVSALIAGFISPRNMILVSLFFCVLASVLLCFLAGTSVYGLYAGTALLGCFVSWQFGSCFSWVAKKVDVTGRFSSIFFIGCGAGSLSVPPLAGFIFTSSLGPMSVIYLGLAFCVLQCFLFASMWLVARARIMKSK